MPIEHAHHASPFGSLVVVFGLNIGLLLSVALVFLIAGRRSEGSERGAYLALARSAVIACIAAQLLSASYYARLVAGTAEEGTVTDVRLRMTGRKPSCRLTLETAHGTTEIPAEWGGCYNLPLGTKVPIITVANSTWFAQLGERATVNPLIALFGGFALMMLLMVGVLIRSLSRAPDLPQS